MPGSTARPPGSCAGVNALRATRSGALIVTGKGGVVNDLVYRDNGGSWGSGLSDGVYRGGGVGGGVVQVAGVKPGSGLRAPSPLAPPNQGRMGVCGKEDHW